ncbi:MAG: response regulator [Pseudomonadota bacterium]
MSPSVYVKVVGFKGVERHVLNNVFSRSVGRATSYGLWTPDAPAAPLLALIDLDADNAAQEIRALDSIPDVKMICVGHGAPAQAWRTFERPLHWPDIVSAMDSLFLSLKPSQADIDLDGHHDSGPPSVKVSLLVDPSKVDRFYLRARLSLAGHTQVDETGFGAQAVEMAKKRHYDLVIVAMDTPDMDGWELIRQLVMLEPAIGKVIVTSKDKSWHMREHADMSGCQGLLEKPFDPLQIIDLLQKI